jgi:hypothetical protein
VREEAAKLKPMSDAELRAYKRAQTEARMGR